MLAAAVRHQEGQPVAAIHIAASLAEWEVEAFRRRVRPLAIEAAGALSQAEGWPGAP
ncbi:hypothetical protein ACFQU7_25975 [Pseudoroseomonas wenyumeiae]